MNHDDCNCNRCEREAEAEARRRERNDDDEPCDRAAGRVAGPLAVRCDDCGAPLRRLEGPLCDDCEADRGCDADDACDDDGYEADA